MARVQRKYKGKWIDLEDFKALQAEDAESDSKPLNDHTVDELKDMLKDRDMKVSGTKQELIDRLEEGSK